MTGHVLKLRKSMGDEARTVADSLRQFRQQPGSQHVQTPPPDTQTFNQVRARELHDVANHVMSGGKVLIDFIDSERSLARTAGVETIGIEVATILAGEQMGRLSDAIKESIGQNEVVHISHEGLGELRRLEKLLAEASSSIDRFTNAGYRLAEASRARAERESERLRQEIKLQEQRLHSMKQQHELQGHAAREEQDKLSEIDHINDADLLAASNNAPQESGSIWGPLLGVGIVATVAIVVVVLIGKN